jgi:hypothetical protein
MGVGVGIGMLVGIGVGMGVGVGIGMLVGMGTGSGSIIMGASPTSPLLQPPIIKKLNTRSNAFILIIPPSSVMVL